MAYGDPPNFFQERALRRIAEVGGCADSRKVSMFYTVSGALERKGYIAYTGKVYGKRGGSYDKWEITEFGREWLARYPEPESCYRVGETVTVNGLSYVFYATVDKTVPKWFIEWRSSRFRPQDLTEVRCELEERLTSVFDAPIEGDWWFDIAAKE